MSELSNIFIGDYTDVSETDVVRLAVKDNIDIEGRVTTAGSCALRDTQEQPRDAAVINRIRSNADIRIVGKTNLDEFAAGATGQNTSFGDVPNPFDKDRMSGGSSSGSAVAIATGLADVALGTDTGGSVRIPAALCGVASLKTTAGSISMRGIYPLSQTLDTVGPMGRDIDHVSSLFEAMSGQALDSNNVTSLEEIKVARLRFAEEETVVDILIDELIRALECKTQDLKLASWVDTHLASYNILSYEGYNNNRDLIEQNADLIGPIPSAVFHDGSKLKLSDYAAALQFKDAWAVEVESQFNKFDILVCPTVANVAPKYDDLATLDWGSYSRTMQFNLSGHPAVNVPIKVPQSELYVGVQIVGPLGSESKLLAIGKKIETMAKQLETTGGGR